MIIMFKPYMVEGFSPTFDITMAFVNKEDAVETYEAMRDSREYTRGYITMTEGGKVLAHYEYEESDDYIKLTSWVKK